VRRLLAHHLRAASSAREHGSAELPTIDIEVMSDVPQPEPVDF